MLFDVTNQQDGFQATVPDLFLPKKELPPLALFLGELEDQKEMCAFQTLQGIASFQL